MERRLLAFDIDGTLLDDQKRPLQSTLDALKKLRQEGHLVTIATGRSRFYAQQVIRELGFDNYILCNGAAAFLDHEQVYKNLLDDAALKRLFEKAAAVGIDTAYLNLDSIRRTSSNNVSVIDDAMKSFGADLPELNMDFPEEKEVYQALAFYNESQGHYFENQYPEFRFVRWHENGVDVVPNNGSKAATLQFLADRVGIKHENVIAFGDGRNDLEMLAKAGIGVAMGNGADYVQAAADMVTDTNERDGIAKALKKLDLI